MEIGNQCKKLMKHPKTLNLHEVGKGIDGIHFINVYSQSTTPLGRLLSNFANTPFKYKNKFYQSVEGYWYSVMTGIDLSQLHGPNAKLIGKSYKIIRPQPAVLELKRVYMAKLRHNPRIVTMLLENSLPFAHFYVFGGKRVSADKYLWTVDLWRALTNKLKEDGNP
jgi:hypothetical protein